MLFIDTPIEFLKGVGPTRAQLLQSELDIYTYGDLLEYFPYRYVDRSQISSISKILAICGLKNPADKKRLCVDSI